MYVAFRKTLKSDSISAKLINLGTGRKGFHHVELVFNDGSSFSADSYDEVQVRFKDIDYTQRMDRWELVKLPDHLNEETMKRFAEHHKGADYDWKGLFLNFLIPVGQHHVSKWFCSEITSEALKYGGEMRLAGETSSGISPNKLYIILTTTI